MEVSVLIERGCIDRLAPVVSARDGGSFKHNLARFGYPDVYSVDGTTHRTDCVRLVLMVARHCGETLREPVSHNHADAHGVHEPLHLGRHRGSRGGEYVRIDESYLMAHYPEKRLVDELVFKRESQGRAFSTGETFHVMASSHLQRVAEYLLLHRRGAVYLVLYRLIHLLPEARHCRHARGMGLLHRLLYLARVGVYDELRTLRETQV
ncbi:unknown [Prevotella sp. CAG:487]|nr:unknown [Prevotella sp. CAG:487]